MKRKRFGTADENEKARGIFTVFISILLVVLTCVFGSNISAYIGNFAVIGASLALPEGGKGAIRELINAENPTVDNATESETAPPVISTPKNKENTDPLPSNAANIEYLTKTPDDVLAVMEAALKNADNEKNDGKTVEKKFTSADGTDSYKLISVKNVTTSTSINFEDLSTRGMELEIADKSQPSVLIYHSHTTETYCLLDNGKIPFGFNERSDERGVNMVRVGDEIAKELENAGYSVIHDTNIYDKNYTDAYDLSREAIEGWLKKYPSIQITLDVHRDAIHYSSTSYAKPTAEIFGKKAAQIMIITGTEGGNVKSFPNWEQNLDFALTLYNYAENMYSGLMKPIYFCHRKYNMDLGKYSLLLEMGADANTLEEAVYSGRLIGNALAAILKDYS